ncbi:MAG: chitinase [Lachnospiraceae bacterium]|nr:chitinase [Lachnospiraceae bacterium]
MRPDPGRGNGRNNVRRNNSASTRKVSRSNNIKRKRRVRRRPNEVAKRRRRRKFNQALGKFIPVFLAVVLMVLLVGIFYGSKLVERYKYSGKYADLNEYFGVFYDYQVALIIDNVKAEEKGVYYKGNYYLSQDDVKKYFTNHFYVNVDEQNALYTTQNEVIKTSLNQSKDFCYYFGDEKRELSCAPVITNDGKVYFSLDYLKLFADFSVTKFDNPKRMVIYTKDTVLDKATVNKETKVRYRGGVKSDILKDMNESDTVFVLEEMEDWAKVQTTDGFIGYIEIKRYDMSGKESISIEKCEVPLEFASIKYDGKINMAFHQLFDVNASDFSDVPKDAGINVVAPTVFRVTDDEGTIKNTVNANYVANAHDAGVKVWGVWTDVDDEVSLSGILSSYNKRQEFINNMITMTQEGNLDGINLDFEKIPSESGSDWAEFLRELSVATHKAGIVLSVDNYAPTASTAHYSRAVQGQVCDYVIVMGYDEHWASGGVAGSVASIGFVEDGIVNTIDSGVPAEKLINAVPFYTRVWKTKEDGSVTADTMSVGKTAEWCTECGVELNWDDTTCQNYGSKEMNSILYQVWMEDGKSLEAKLSVMDAHNCAGVAEWKLGFDTPELWAAIRAYLGLAPAETE